LVADTLKCALWILLIIFLTSKFLSPGSNDSNADYPDQQYEYHSMPMSPSARKRVTFKSPSIATTKLID